jgi:SAM-dependent methyltransferase
VSFVVEIVNPLTPAEARLWQQSWDAQQEGYIPDREERFAFMIGLLGTLGEPLRVLDLACGCGSLSKRVLERYPSAKVVGVDIDPVLLAIYEACFAGDERAACVAADLETADWRAGDVLGKPASFDVIITATALHWLPAEALERLYRDAAELLRAGGMFCNADHDPFDRCPALASATAASREAERLALGGRRDSWQAWWDRVASDPKLAPLFEARRRRFPEGHSEEHQPPESWHLCRLSTAGFAEAASVWRRGEDAIVAAVR